MIHYFPCQVLIDRPTTHYDNPVVRKTIFNPLTASTPNPIASLIYHFFSPLKNTETVFSKFCLQASTVLGQVNSSQTVKGLNLKMYRLGSNFRFIRLPLPPNCIVKILWYFCGGARPNMLMLVSNVRKKFSGDFLFDGWVGESCPSCPGILSIYRNLVTEIMKLVNPTRLF